MTESKQQLFAVTGNPVLSSQTPPMINAALAQAGISGRCLRLAADTVEEAVQLVRLLNIQGMVVEPPFQEAALALANRPDDAARTAGAVNTLVPGTGASLAGFFINSKAKHLHADDFPAPVDQTAAFFARLTGNTGDYRRPMAEAFERGNKNFPGRIALIGFMGCGKTRNGRQLARRMDWRFRDMDVAIEKTAGRTIPEIFSQDGEEAFRTIESQVLEKFSNSIETVVSCGGGVVTRPENRRLLKKHFLCVWLVASIDTIIARTSGSDRPLLAVEDPRTEAQALFEARRDMYADCADLVVSTEPLCQRDAPEKMDDEIRLAFPD